jgi:hypothetical protein
LAGGWLAGGWLAGGWLAGGWLAGGWLAGGWLAGGACDDDWLLTGDDCVAGVLGGLLDDDEDDDDDDEDDDDEEDDELVEVDVLVGDELVVVGELLVVEVSLLLGCVVPLGPDDGGATTVDDPSGPVTVIVVVSGSPGTVGFVTAVLVADGVLLVLSGLLALVSVHTRPPVAASTAIKAAPNNTCGRRYHGNGGASTGPESGGMNSTCGRAAASGG